MPIPRMHLFELEDQPWFPPVIRDLATDYLHFVEMKFELHRPVIPLLAQALREAGTDRVVDLCSGGGGPTLRLCHALAEAGVPIRVTLTDRYPNADAFNHVASTSEGAISAVLSPVDARQVPPDLVGFRTIFNAYHHFAPGEAVAVLQDAVNARQPIGIFEIPDRRVGMLLPMIFLTPLMVLLTTPMIRPFSWRRLLWTYLLPFVPLTCWWDGIVSQLRAYTPAELEQFARDAASTSYSWQSGKAPIGSVPGVLTYLIGMPLATDRPCQESAESTLSADSATGETRAN